MRFVDDFQNVASFVIPTEKWYKENAMCWNELNGVYRKLVCWVLYLIKMIGQSKMRKKKKKNNPNSEALEDDIDDIEETMTSDLSVSSGIFPTLLLQKIDSEKTKIPYYVLHILVKGQHDFNKAIEVWVDDYNLRSQYEMIRQRRNGVIESSTNKRKFDENAITISTYTEFKEVITGYLNMMNPIALNDLNLYNFSLNPDPNKLDKIYSIFSQETTLKLLQNFVSSDRLRSINTFYSDSRSFLNRNSGVSRVILRDDLEFFTDINIFVPDKKLPHFDQNLFKVIKIFEKVKDKPLTESEISKILKNDLESINRDYGKNNGKKRYNDVIGLIKNKNSSAFEKLESIYANSNTKSDLIDNYVSDIKKIMDTNTNELLTLLSPQCPEIYQNLLSCPIQSLFKWININRKINGNYYFFCKNQSDDESSTKNDDIKAYGFRENEMSGLYYFSSYILNRVNNIEFSCPENNSVLLFSYTLSNHQFSPTNGVRLYGHIQGPPAASKSYILTLIEQMIVDLLISMIDDFGSEHSMGASSTLLNYSYYMMDEGIPIQDNAKGITELNRIKLMFSKNERQRTRYVLDEKKSDGTIVSHTSETKVIWLEASNYQVKNDALKDRFISFNVVPNYDISERIIAKKNQKKRLPTAFKQFRNNTQDLNALCGITNLNIAICGQYEANTQASDIIINSLVKKLKKRKLHFKFEVRDSIKLSQFISTSVIMNSWIEELMFDTIDKKREPLSSKMILEAAKRQFSTIDITLYCFSLLYNSYQDTRVNCLREYLFTKHFNILQNLKLSYRIRCGVECDINNSEFNHVTHIINLKGAMNTKYDFRVIKHGGIDYYDFNYVEFEFEGYTDCFSSIEAAMNTSYIYNAKDYADCVRKSGYKMIPKKVLKYCNKSIFDGLYSRFITTVDPNYVRSKLEEDDSRGEFSIRDVVNKYDEITTELFTESQMIDECLNGESMLQSEQRNYFIYSKENGLPMFIVSKIRKGSFKFSVLLELFRNDPNSMLLECVSKLKKFVTKDTKVPLMIDHDIKIVTIKPSEDKVSYSKNYIKKKYVKNTFGSIFDDLDDFSKSEYVDENSCDQMDEEASFGSEKVINFNEKTLSRKFHDACSTEQKIVYENGIDVYYAKLHLEKYGVSDENMKKYISKLLK